MKKIMLMAVITAAFTACDGGKNQKSAEDLTRDSLTQVINQKELEMNDILNTFNEIQEGFREINEAEGRVNLSKANPEASSRAEIAENINFIKEKMKLNRELIEQLRKQLKGRTASSEKLQKTLDELTAQLEAKQAQIDNLQAELAAKNIQIEKQGEEINTLNTNVSNLKSENQAQSSTIASQDKEMNTAWYVFGTKKELKEQKILQSGDVLKSDNYNKDYFTRIDIRVDKVIKLYSKSAKLLTNHPAGSYSLDRDADGQYTLRITNPKTFWSVSKYLVIVVK